jgi:hypothetical protein
MACYGDSFTFFFLCDDINKTEVLRDHFKAKQVGLNLLQNSTYFDMVLVVFPIFSNKMLK